VAISICTKCMSWQRRRFHRAEVAGSKPYGGAKSIDVGETYVSLHPPYGHILRLCRKIWNFQFQIPPLLLFANTQSLPIIGGIKSDGARTACDRRYKLKIHGHKLWKRVYPLRVPWDSGRAHQFTGINIFSTKYYHVGNRKNTRYS